jgi:tRNA (guanine-N7-)-methyltransferase
VVRPTTKYEDKARHAGSAVTELLWQRRSERDSR